jgi:transposase-like protein
MNDGTLGQEPSPFMWAGEALEEIAREGARRLLRLALEAEVGQFLQQFEVLKDDRGRQRLVRNGYLPEREILTGIGPLAVRQPRVRDRAATEERMHFSSAIIPPYLRRCRSLDGLIPWLYLKGISAGQMQDALSRLVGEAVENLSASVVLRLKEEWTAELNAWRERDLGKSEYVYFWADGIYFNIRLEGDRQCILVIVGATAEGKKELVAIQDGYRESEQSWYELLLDLKRRGLTIGPKLAIGDGALGFWNALRKVYPGTREQRCWVHKTANVLDKLPKGLQERAKEGLHEIWMAENRGEAQVAVDAFVEKYAAKYPKASECLVRDIEELLTFYDFPAEHWIHLRTTNPIESTFATVRLRHQRTKGSGSRTACLAMVFKLVQSAERYWRRLNGAHFLPEVIHGTKFVDGLITSRDAA